MELKAQAQISSVSFFSGLLPIDGDLKGYLSGRSTRTFHTPPSYGAGCEEETQIGQLLRACCCWIFYTLEVYFDHPLRPDLQPDQGRHQHHNTLLIILCSNLLQHWRIPYFQAASSSTPTSKRQTVGLCELCDVPPE